jgi:phosphoglycolate phosphatase
MCGAYLGDVEIKAVVFDLDGTLIVTTVDFRKMKERLISDLVGRGVPPSLLDPKDTIVNNLVRVNGYLRSAGRESEVRELDREVGELMNSTEMERVSETVAVAGARDALREIRRMGLPVGLLTRGSRAYALAALRYSGLGTGFDAMVCRDDYPEPEAKPNGMALRRIAERLGVEAGESLLVGDHKIDLDCAQSAHAPFVGVLTGAFREEDWSRNGDALVISSVAELPRRLRTA